MSCLERERNNGLFLFHFDIVRRQTGMGHPVHLNANGNRAVTPWQILGAGTIGATSLPGVGPGTGAEFILVKSEGRNESIN